MLATENSVDIAIGSINLDHMFWPIESFESNTVLFIDPTEY